MSASRLLCRRWLDNNEHTRNLYRPGKTWIEFRLLSETTENPIRKNINRSIFWAQVIYIFIWEWKHVACRDIFVLSIRNGLINIRWCRSKMYILFAFVLSSHILFVTVTFSVNGAKNKQKKIQNARYLRQIVHVYRRNRLMNNLSCAFNNSQKTINEKNSLVFFLVPQPSAYRNNVPIYNAKLFNRKSSCNKNEFNAWPNRGLLQLPSPLIAYMKKSCQLESTQPPQHTCSLSLSALTLSPCFVSFNFNYKLRIILIASASFITRQKKVRFSSQTHCMKLINDLVQVRQARMHFFTRQKLFRLVVFWMNGRHGEVIERSSDAI